MTLRHSACIGLLLFLGACGVPGEAHSVTLYFYSDQDMQTASFDHPVAINQTIRSGDDLALMNTAVHFLFMGPTPEQQKAGARTSADLQALEQWYLGMSVENGVAILNFQPAALSILNSAAARQLMVKAPIERTLLQFSQVREVKYAIDGTIFEEWDA